MYQQVIAQLRKAYNRGAAQRERGEKSDWKVVERQHFLDLLQKSLNNFLNWSILKLQKFLAIMIFTFSP